MNDKIDAGGLSFDGAALDALLDESTAAPATQEQAENDHRVDVDDVPAGDSPPQDRVSEDESPQLQEGDDAVSEDADTSAEETRDSEDDEASVSEDSGEDTDSLSFITDGDEGPMLLTGVNDDGQPIYETADELFGSHSFKIKAAGEEHTVTFDELRKGYQRQVDYTKGKTEVNNVLRQIKPFLGLVNMWEASDEFRSMVTDYIEGARNTGSIDDQIMAAYEAGEEDKVKTLIQRRKQNEERAKAYQVAEQATSRQQQAFAQEQHRIANTLIDNYNETIPNVKAFLQTLGYGDQEIEGIEYADARLQNLAYLAYRQANPASASTSNRPVQKALQSKRKMIVKRPPKPVPSGAGTSNTPQAAHVRQAQAAYRKAYKTGKSSDIEKALALSIPDDLLED